MHDDCQYGLPLFFYQNFHTVFLRTLNTHPSVIYKIYSGDHDSSQSSIQAESSKEYYAFRFILLLLSHLFLYSQLSFLKHPKKSTSQTSGLDKKIGHYNITLHYWDYFDFFSHFPCLILWYYHYPRRKSLDCNSCVYEYLDTLSQISTQQIHMMHILPFPCLMFFSV